MLQIMPDHMLAERGRCCHERGLLLDLPPAVGRKEWRAALGKDFDAAYGRQSDLKHEHDTLIATLENAEERQIYKTSKRRISEIDQARRESEADAAQEKWRTQNGLKTESEDYADDLEDLKHLVAHPLLRSQAKSVRGKGKCSHAPIKAFRLYVEAGRSASRVRPKGGAANRQSR